MADPACKDCRFFYQAPLTTKGGECMDPSKRIYPRRTAASEVDPPFIIDEEIYTCRNWTGKDTPSFDVSTRYVQMRSLDVKVLNGWHVIVDGSTGEYAVELTEEMLRQCLVEHGKCDVVGSGLYARNAGPFGLDVHGKLKPDGSLECASVTVYNKSYAEGYDPAHVGCWIVLTPSGEIEIRKNWQPSSDSSRPTAG